MCQCPCTSVLILYSEYVHIYIRTKLVRRIIVYLEKKCQVVSFLLKLDELLCCCMQTLLRGLKITFSINTSLFTIIIVIKSAITIVMHVTKYFKD